jgi:hypothetical protein
VSPSTDPTKRSAVDTVLVVDDEVLVRMPSHNTCEIAATACWRRPVPTRP